jgi:flagellar protein FlaG
MEAIKALSPKPMKGPVEVTASNVLTSESNVEKDNNIMIARTNEQIHQNAKKVQETTNAKINRIAEAMDNYVRSVKRELKIQVHSETGNIMVKVISQENGKVIREIPPKELLDLAAKMEEMTGTLLNQNV